VAASRTGGHPQAVPPDPLMDSRSTSTQAQILTVRQVGGTTIEISDDVQGVARSLREIDDRFRLRADLDHVQNLLGWTVELHIEQPDGSTEEHFVCAYRELDHRIVRDARRYTSAQLQHR
jgi:hypothetical protein